MNKFLVSCVLVGFLSALQSQEIRSKADGNCEECKDNEFAVSAVVEIGPGDYVYENDPSCGNDLNTGLQELIRLYANSQIPGISSYAGPILDGISTALGDTIKTNIHGSLGQWLSPLTNPHANCRIVAVIIPKGSQYKGYRLEMCSSEHNFDHWNKYGVGADCGWCKFATEPIVEWTPNGGIVYTTFKNWSHDRTRRAKITAYFLPPENWQPPR